jgi:signal transduction histidine kinase
MTVDPEGTEALTTFARIPSTGWVLVGVYPKDEAFAPVKKLSERFLEVLVVACLIVAAGVWQFTRTLVKQLKLANKGLEQMRLQISEELRKRSQYFHEASHDFRQRLHAIQLLGHALETIVPREGKFIFSKLTFAIVSLQLYIKNFLDLAQLEAAGTTPNIQAVHLQDVFQKLELSLEDLAESKGVELRIRATDISIATDEKMLARLLENISCNAIKYTRSRVLITARRRGKGVTIEVWDNGRGISEGELESIFVEFYQTKSALDAKEHGVGLGLSIVKRLAAMLKCHVEIRSKEHRGTVLRVTFSEILTKDTFVSNDVSEVVDAFPEREVLQ